jgi:hypothetical protein
VAPNRIQERVDGHLEEDIVTGSPTIKGIVTGKSRILNQGEGGLLGILRSPIEGPTHILAGG